MQNKVNSNPQVQRTEHMSRNDAIMRAKQLVGNTATVHKINLDGEQAEKVERKVIQDKVASLATQILRQENTKTASRTAIQLTPETVTFKGASKKTTYDPVEVLAKVEKKNQEDDKSTSSGIFANPLIESMKTATFMVISSTLKDLSSRLVNLVRGDKRKEQIAGPTYRTEAPQAILPRQDHTTSPTTANKRSVQPTSAA